jgi:hypothetical protein
MEHLPDFYDFLKFLYLFSKRDATILSPPGGAPAKNEKSDWQQVVIPAKAGIQSVNLILSSKLPAWIPAFAGMTTLD